jgi:hypothetical protein
MEKRLWSLRAYQFLSAFLAVLLIGVAVAQDLDPKPVRSDGEMIVVFAIALVGFALLDLFNCWRIRRWFRQGRPPIV